VCSPAAPPRNFLSSRVLACTICASRRAARPRAPAWSRAEPASPARCPCTPPDARNKSSLRRRRPSCAEPAPLLCLLRAGTLPCCAWTSIHAWQPLQPPVASHTRTRGPPWSCTHARLRRRRSPWSTPASFSHLRLLPSRAAPPLHARAARTCAHRASAAEPQSDAARTRARRASIWRRRARFRRSPARSALAHAGSTWELTVGRIRSEIRVRRRRWARQWARVSGWDGARGR
jgi:hypothetical protein